MEALHMYALGPAYLWSALYLTYVTSVLNIALYIVY